MKRCRKPATEREDKNSFYEQFNHEFHETRRTILRISLCFRVWRIGIRELGFGRPRQPSHPGGNPEANLKSISHRCHPILVVFVWVLT